MEAHASSINVRSLDLPTLRRYMTCPLSHKVAEDPIVEKTANCARRVFSRPWHERYEEDVRGAFPDDNIPVAGELKIDRRISRACRLLRKEEESLDKHDIEAIYIGADILLASCKELPAEPTLVSKELHDRISELVPATSSEAFPEVDREGSGCVAGKVSLFPSNPPYETNPIDKRDILNILQGKKELSGVEPLCMSLDTLNVTDIVLNIIDSTALALIGCSTIALGYLFGRAINVLQPMDLKCWVLHSLANTLFGIIGRELSLNIIERKKDKNPWIRCAISALCALGATTILTQNVSHVRLRRVSLIKRIFNTFVTVIPMSLFDHCLLFPTMKKIVNKDKINDSIECIDSQIREIYCDKFNATSFFNRKVKTRVQFFAQHKNGKNAKSELRLGYFALKKHLAIANRYGVQTIPGVEMDMARLTLYCAQNALKERYFG